MWWQTIVKSEDCLDRISSLPDDLLGHILSFLSTRSAMGTSILSKRWRYLFTLTNSLSFDDYPCSGMNDAMEEMITKIVMSKIYSVMHAHQISPIKKFSLDFQGNHDESTLNSCISYAVQKGVQDLDVEAIVPLYYKPPDEFLRCRTLVRLKMQSTGANRIYFPLSALLPSLKVLHLEHVTFSNDKSLKRCFSRCEFLEELTLKDCDGDSDCEIIISARQLKILTIKTCFFAEGLFEIDAPNLVRLSYESNIGVEIVPSWKDSRSLAKAELSFCYDAAEDKNISDTLQQDFGLIKAAADTFTELHLMSNSLELIMTEAGHEEMPDLHSLSRLHLCGCSYKAWKYVTSLLEKSPQLETVIFERCWHSSSRDPVTPPNEDLITFTCHAKVIEVRDFCGGAYLLLFLGHLLRNAGVLKRLILYRRYYFHPAEQWRISKDFDILRLLPRASKDSCIEMIFSH